MTEGAVRVASHEAAHAVLAHLLGLRVGFVSRQRGSSIHSKAGATMTIFREDDPRPVRQKAFDRAVIALGAVLVESGHPGLFSCDEDVTRASEYALEADTSLGQVTERAKELIGSDLFRTGHAAIENALMSKTHLDEATVAELLR